MISVNLYTHFSGPEPVITTALHTSQDCDEDQMHKGPGNCETLSDGRTSHTRCIISGYFDQLSCKHCSASARDFLLHPGAGTHPIMLAGVSLVSGLSAHHTTSVSPF